MYYLNLAFLEILFAVLIFTILLSTGRFTLRIRSTRPDIIIYSYLSISVFTILVVDSVLWYGEGFPEAINHSLYVFLYIIYYALHLAPPSLYILYADYHLSGNVERTRKILKIVIPINVVELILSITSPWTQFFFIINQDNMYTRGKGVIILAITTALLTILGMVMVIAGRKKQNRKTILTLMLFPVISLTFGMLQATHFGISVTWPSAVVFILAAALNIQKVKINTDNLTGLKSREYFENSLRDQLKVIRKTENRLAVMMLDIDYFKEVNDTWGHLYGDQILKRIAAAMEELMKEQDVVARYGGEEFIILSRYESERETIETAEKIREAVARMEHREKHTTTISIGVTVVQPGEDVYRIIRRADDNLYTAKQNGRNQTVFR